MKVTWLGQAGLYLETDGLRVLVDPYLSDSVGQVDPAKHRKMPVQDWMLELRPDVLIFTHDHLDHYDPWSAEHFLHRGNEMTVLGPGTCWQKARANGGGHNYVLFDQGTRWTEKGVRFTAVPAIHSDPAAIGLVIEAEGRRVYITGDTLYAEKVLKTLPDQIDAVFLPVNGVGNNMNMVDAAQFAKDCNAKLAVPIHWGLFDSLDPKEFAFEPKIIPQYGGTIEIGESV